MAAVSQRKASNAYRKRESAKGLVRIEVRVNASDASLVRSVVDILRTEHADALRTALQRAVGKKEVHTAFDIFGSDLPDEYFDGVFERPSDTGWRDIDI